jgi:hypothetical protein
MKSLGLINFSGGLGEALALNACIISISKIFDLEYFIVGTNKWIEYNTIVKPNSIRPAKNVTGWMELFKEQDRLEFLDIMTNPYHNLKIHESNKLINTVFLKDWNSHYYLKNEINFEKINRFVGNNQDVRSWIDYKKEIKNSLNLNYFNIDPNITVVHVRRTDWPSAHWSFIDLCFTDYYINAINQAGNESVLFVTDDTEWTENWFESFKSETICKNVNYDNSIPINAFEIMLNAKYLVISQSSFARWAAYLNDNHIFYPELFFKQSPDSNLKLDKDKNQFYIEADNWHKIKYIN